MENSGCIILMDSNAWLGPKVIPNDPHKQNKNGELFHNFLKRNPQMHLLNSSSLCNGLITRSRVVENRCERSVIDFVIVCDKVMPLMTKFVVDENKTFGIASYSRKQIRYSDHNSLIGFFETKIRKSKIERKLIFDYKKVESMNAFKKMTSQNENLINVFSKQTNLPKQIQTWWKQVKNTMFKHFQKVRVRKRRPKFCKSFKKRKFAILVNIHRKE